MGLFDRLFGTGTQKRVPRTWENLPSCTMLLLQDFDLPQIIAAARSSRKDIVCLAPPGAAVDPAGFGQIELLYRFADEQTLAVLTWRGMAFVRREFLAKCRLTSTRTFPEFVRGLGTQARHEGLRCDSI